MLGKHCSTGIPAGQAYRFLNFFDIVLPLVEAASESMKLVCACVCPLVTGALRMLDGGKRDEKVLCVHTDDPSFRGAV